MELSRVVEALIFASQEPLSVPEMVRAVRDAVKDAAEEAKENNTELDAAKAELKDVDEIQVRAALDQLVQHYEADGRSFTLVERTAGWRLSARPELADWCRALYPGKKPQKLSAPAVETLAIIAYRQPITKSAIEAVRGVSVDAMVQQLLDRGLVKIDGRADLPGRPLLYSTTDAFLDHFGIRTLDDLPNAGELRRVKLPTPEDQVAPADAAAGDEGKPAKGPELTLGFGEDERPAAEA
jgi:segregation and condensation protein B